MTATKPPAQPAGANPAPPGAKKKDADRNRKEGAPGYSKTKDKRKKTPAGLWTTVSVHPSMFSLLRFDLALVQGNTRSNDAVRDVLGEDEIQPVDIDLFDLEFDPTKIKKGGKYSLYGVPNGAGGKGEPPKYTDEQWQRAVVLFENQTLSPDASKIDSKELAPAPLLGADEAPDATERLAKIQELGDIQLAKYLTLQIEGRPARGIAERGRAAKAEAGVHLKRLKALGFRNTGDLQKKVTKVFEICQIGAGFDVHQARFAFGDVSVTEKGTFNCTASLIANETAIFLRGVLDLKAFIEDDALGVKKWISEKTGGKVTIDAKFGPGQTTLVAKLKKGTWEVDLEYVAERLVKRFGGFFWLPDRVVFRDPSSKKPVLKLGFSHHRKKSPNKRGRALSLIPEPARGLVDAVLKEVASADSLEFLQSSPLSCSHLGYSKGNRLIQAAFSIDWGNEEHETAQHINVLIAASAKGVIGALGSALPTFKTAFDRFKVADHKVHVDFPEKKLRLSYDLDRAYESLDLHVFLPDHLVRYADGGEGGKKRVLAEVIKHRKRPAKEVKSAALALGDLPDMLLNPIKDTAVWAGLIESKEKADALIDGFEVVFLEPSRDYLPKVFAPREEGKKEKHDRYILPVAIELRHKESASQLAYEIKLYIDCKKTYQWLEGLYKKIPKSPDDVKATGKNGRFTLRERVLKLLAQMKAVLEKAGRKASELCDFDYVEEQAMVRFIFKDTGKPGDAAKDEEKDKKEAESAVDDADKKSDTPDEPPPPVTYGRYRELTIDALDQVKAGLLDPARKDFYVATGMLNHALASKPAKLRDAVNKVDKAARDALSAQLRPHANTDAPAPGDGFHLVYMGIVQGIEAAAKALPKTPPALGVGRAFDQAASKAFCEASADPKAEGPKPPAPKAVKAPVEVKKDPTRAGFAKKLRFYRFEVLSRSALAQKNWSEAEQKAFPGKWKTLSDAYEKTVKALETGTKPLRRDDLSKVYLDLCFGTIEKAVQGDAFAKRIEEPLKLAVMKAIDAFLLEAPEVILGKAAGAKGKASPPKGKEAFGKKGSKSHKEVRDRLVALLTERMQKAVPDSTATEPGLRDRLKGALTVQLLPWGDPDDWDPKEKIPPYDAHSALKILRAKLSPLREHYETSLYRLFLPSLKGLVASAAVEADDKTRRTVDEVVKHAAETWLDPLLTIKRGRPALAITRRSTRRGATGFLVTVEQQLAERAAKKGVTRVQRAALDGVRSLCAIYLGHLRDGQTFPCEWLWSAAELDLVRAAESALESAFAEIVWSAPPEEKPEKRRELSYIGFRLDKLIARLLDKVELSDFVPDEVFVREAVYDDWIPITLLAERKQTQVLGLGQPDSRLDLDLLPAPLSEGLQRLAPTLGFNAGSVREFEALKLDTVTIDITKTSVIDPSDEEDKEAAERYMVEKEQALVIEGDLYRKADAIACAREAGLTDDGKPLPGAEKKKAKHAEEEGVEEPRSLQVYEKLSFALVIEINPALKGLKRMARDLGRYIYVKLLAAKGMIKSKSPRMRKKLEVLEDKGNAVRSKVGRTRRKVQRFSQSLMEDLSERGWSIDASLKLDYKQLSKNAKADAANAKGAKKPGEAVTKEKKPAFPLVIECKKVSTELSPHLTFNGRLSFDMAELFKGLSWATLENLKAEFSGRYGPLFYELSLGGNRPPEKEAKGKGKKDGKGKEKAEAHDVSKDFKMELIPDGLIDALNEAIHRRLPGLNVDKGQPDLIRRASMEYTFPAAFRLDLGMVIKPEGSKDGMRLDVGLSVDLFEFLFPDLKKLYEELSERPDPRRIIARLKAMAQGGQGAHGMGPKLFRWIVDKLFDWLERRRQALPKKQRHEIEHLGHEHRGIRLHPRYLSLAVERRKGTIFLTLFGQIRQFSWCVGFDLSDASKGFWELLKPDDYGIAYTDPEDDYSFGVGYEPKQKVFPKPKDRYDFRSDKPITLERLRDSLDTFFLPDCLKDPILNAIGGAETEIQKGQQRARMVVHRDVGAFEIGLTLSVHKGDPAPVAKLPVPRVDRKKKRKPDALDKLAAKLPQIDLTIGIHTITKKNGLVRFELEVSLTRLLVMIVRRLLEKIAKNPRSFVKHLKPLLKKAGGSNGAAGRVLRGFKLGMKVIEIDFTGDGWLAIIITKPARLEVCFDLNAKTVKQLLIPVSYKVGYRFDAGIEPSLCYQFRRLDPTKGGKEALGFGGTHAKHRAAVKKAANPPADPKAREKDFDEPWKNWANKTLSPLLNKGIDDPLERWPRDKRALLVGAENDLPDLFKEYALRPLRELFDFRPEVLVLAGDGTAVARSPKGPQAAVVLSLYVVEPDRLHLIAFRVKVEIVPLVKWLVLKVAPKLLQAVPVIGQVITAAMIGYEIYCFLEKLGVIDVVGKAVANAIIAVFDGAPMVYEAAKKAMEQALVDAWVYIGNGDLGRDAAALLGSTSAAREQRAIELARQRARAFGARKAAQMHSQEDAFMRLCAQAVRAHWLNGFEYALLVNRYVPEKTQKKVLKQIAGILDAKGQLTKVRGKEFKRRDKQFIDAWSELRKLRKSAKLKEAIEDALADHTLRPGEYEFLRALLMPTRGITEEAIYTARMAVMHDESLPRIRRLILADVLYQDWLMGARGKTLDGFTALAGPEIQVELNALGKRLEVLETRRDEAKKALVAARKAKKPADAAAREYEDANARAEGVKLIVDRSDFWIRMSWAKRWLIGVADEQRVSLKGPEGLAPGLGGGVSKGRPTNGASRPATVSAFETEQQRRRGYLIGRLRAAGLVPGTVPEWEYRLHLLDYGGLDQKAYQEAEKKKIGPSAPLNAKEKGSWKDARKQLAWTPERIAEEILEKAPPPKELWPEPLRWFFLGLLHAKQPDAVWPKLEEVIKKAAEQDHVGAKVAKRDDDKVAVKAAKDSQADDVKRYQVKGREGWDFRLHLWMEWLEEGEAEATKKERPKFEKKEADYEKLVRDRQEKLAKHEKAPEAPKRPEKALKLRGTELLFETYRRVALREWFARTRGVGGEQTASDKGYRKRFLDYGVWSMNQIMAELQAIGKKLKGEDEVLYTRISFLVRLLMARPAIPNYGPPTLDQKTVAELHPEGVRLILLRLIQGAETPEAEAKAIGLLQTLGKKDPHKLSALIRWLADENLLVGGKAFNSASTAGKVDLAATEGVYLDLADNEKHREAFIELVCERCDLPTISTFLEHLLIGYRVYDHNEDMAPVPGFGGVELKRHPDQKLEDVCNAGIRSMVDRLLEKKGKNGRSKLETLFPELGPDGKAAFTTQVVKGKWDPGLKQGMAGSPAQLQALAKVSSDPKAPALQVDFENGLRVLELMEGGSPTPVDAATLLLCLRLNQAAEEGGKVQSRRFLLADLIQWMAEEAPGLLRVELQLRGGSVKPAYRGLPDAARACWVSVFREQIAYTETTATLTWFEADGVGRTGDAPSALPATSDQLRPCRHGVLVCPPGRLGDRLRTVPKKWGCRGAFTLIIPLYDGDGREDDRPAGAGDLPLERHVRRADFVKERGERQISLYPCIAIGRERQLLLRGQTARLGLQAPYNPANRTYLRDLALSGRPRSGFGGRGSQTLYFWSDALSWGRTDINDVEIWNKARTKELGPDQYFFVVRLNQPLVSYHWNEMKLMVRLRVWTPNLSAPEIEYDLEAAAKDAVFLETEYWNPLRDPDYKKIPERGLHKCQTDNHNLTELGGKEVLIFPLDPKAFRSAWRNYVRKGKAFRIRYRAELWYTDLWGDRRHVTGKTDFFYARPKDKR